MAKSMTGFASCEGGADGLSWSWEIRGVNARGLDVRLRLPDRAQALEAPVRTRVGAAVARGSVQIGLRLKTAGGAVSGGVD
ncbi:YicC family protein, partial [Rhodobacterales bacterium HKCCE3408]|nr:YicC family protein [Rhodobacterales bacterium HKCCE3408]